MYFNPESDKLFVHSNANSRTSEQWSWDPKNDLCHHSKLSIQYQAKVCCFNTAGLSVSIPKQQAYHCQAYALSAEMYVTVQRKFEFYWGDAQDGLPLFPRTKASPQLRTTLPSTISLHRSSAMFM